MRRFNGYSVRNFLAAVTLCLSPPLLALENSVTVDAPARVQLTTDGYVLVTPSGMTLYKAGVQRGGGGGRGISYQCLDKAATVTDDQQSGFGPRPHIGAQFLKSCVEKFPRYLAEPGSEPVGDFSLVDTEEGKQWAWQGRPLHLSIKDRHPGDRFGAGSGGGLAGGFGGSPMQLVSLAVDLPMGLTLVTRDEGLVLASADGTPVYTPEPGLQLASAELTGHGMFKPIGAAAIATARGDLSIIDAAAGSKQYAFKGQPLHQALDYLSEVDIDELGGWRKVVYHSGEERPAEIGIGLTLLSEVYTTHDGFSLYVYTCNIAGVPCDDPGDPAAMWTALCGSSEECTQRWRPYLAEEDAVPAGDWSIVDVAYPIFTDPQGVLYPPESPRVRAWAHRGRPVYTYYEDTEPGDMWGDWTRGLWPGGSFSLLQVPGRGLMR